MYIIHLCTFIYMFIYREPMTPEKKLLHKDSQVANSYVNLVTVVNNIFTIAY